MTPFQNKPIPVIISADTEWVITKEYLHPTDIHSSPYGEWFLVEIETFSFLFFQGGWGKISAAASTQYIIDHWNPEMLFNLGTCGGFAESGVKKGDTILANETIVYDIIEQMGDPQEAIQFYTTQSDLLTFNPPYPLPVKLTRLISADRDIVTSEINQLKEQYQAVAADWESGAIAWVAKRNKVVCIILRGITDIVDTEKGEAYGNFEVFIQGTRQILPSLINSLPQWVARIK